MRLLGIAVACAVAVTAITHGVPTLAAFSATTVNPAGTMTATSSFYRAAVIADGPTAYWRLGETSGTTAADAMGAHHGGSGGFITLGVPGALANDTDKAFSTDGGGVSVTDAAPLRYTGAFTIEAWIRPDLLTGDRFILNKGLDYFLYITNGATNFGFRTQQVTYPFVSSTAFTTGTWQHVVGTYSGTALTLYRNGLKVSEVPTSGSLTTVGGNLAIGAFDTTGIAFYDGVLDEVAIYPRALSAASVLYHYQRGALTQ
jgi:hypothetical protein